MQYSTEIYTKTSEIPASWNATIGQKNILLSKEYFSVLENSAPENMQCFFVGFFEEKELIGGALFQYLHFENHQVLQQNKISCNIRNFITKKFCKNVLILGNNMLTGQNGFYFNLEKIVVENAILLLNTAIEKIQSTQKKPSIVILKDYQSSVIPFFRINEFHTYFKFSVQPNMILEIKNHWKSYSDYIADFSKKYRTRAKSARKKIEHIVKTELDLSTVIQYEKELNALYHHVAENASINTFFLAENHFESLKFHLKENFRIFGYFLDEKMVGFYTLIINGEKMDTYFLGYEKTLQKEMQLYLNMLLDMVEFGIKNQFQKIIFGRTALEIKSTIGAQPQQIFGIIKHNNSMINPFMNKIFPFIEPKVEWLQRKPFK